MVAVARPGPAPGVGRFALGDEPVYMLEAILTLLALFLIATGGAVWGVRLGLLPRRLFRRERRGD